MARLASVKLSIGELMRKRGGMTAYGLAAASKGRISQRSAYRLATGDKPTISLEEIAAVCEILKCQPGDLFELKAGKG